MGIPNDATNGRALMVLESAGLIKLKERSVSGNRTGYRRKSQEYKNYHDGCTYTYGL